MSPSHAGGGFPPVPPGYSYEGPRFIPALVFLSVPLLAAARAPKGDVWAAALLAWGVALALEEEAPAGRRALAGLCLGLAPFFKLHAVLAAGGALVGLLAADLRTGRRRDLRAVVVGLGLAAAAWAAYLADLRSAGALSGGLGVAGRVVGSVGTAAAYLDPVRILRSNIWVRDPVLSALGFLGLAALLLGGPSRRRSILLAAVLIPAAAIAFIPYDPHRYRLALLPLLAFAAPAALRADGRAGALAGAALGFAAAFWSAPRLEGLLGAAAPFAVPAGALLGAAVGAAGAARADLRRVEAAILTGVLLAGAQAVWVFRRAGDELAGAARGMEAVVPADAVLAGFWAPNLALWTRHRVSISLENPGCPPATHLVEEDAFLPPGIALEALGEARLPAVRRRIGFYRIGRADAAAETATSGATSDARRSR